MKDFLSMALAVVFFGMLGLGALFSVYVLFVYSSVKLYTEAQCLAKGYPEHRVSVGLERYCMNLDGTVTVRVDKAGE